ncbi:MAG: anti-sigma factor [Actinomycetota bacterium]|nr:anti-sigma factor [Actinomycetota bacterium]
MAPEALHDLTPAYALDALDEAEERAYEAHLAGCEQCREELASLREAATSLAFGVDPVSPPDALRERILKQARAERPNVVPLRPRFVGATRAAAAVASCAAIGLVGWSVHLQREVDRARAVEQEAISVIAEPGTRQIPLEGDRGALYVSPTGAAALVIARLEPAPSGKTYKAWVIENGKPKPAGTFDADETPAVVSLREPVPPGALVAVTQERGDGGPVPRGPRVLLART